MSEYLFDCSPDEEIRLREQSLLLEAPTHSFLDRIELAQGLSCLDVGCGAGDGMRLLGERFGPSGRVVGLDADESLGRAALERLAAGGESRFAFVRGDVLDPSCADPGRFDLVFTRLLLVNLTDPVAALRRMWEWTAPGGCLAVLDYDFTGAGSYPLCESYDEFRQVMWDTFVRSGREPRSGRRLPDNFVHAGIGAPDGTHVGAYFRPMSEVARVARATYAGILPTACRLGVTTAARGQEVLAALEQAGNDDRSYAMGPLLIGAWKRKTHGMSA